MSLQLLRRYLTEAVADVLNEEIYVDENGYAHDDEGNTWYVGKERGGAGQTFGRSGFTRQYGTAGMGSSRARLTPQQIDAINRLALRVPGNDFVTSIKSQTSRGLTPKQMAAIKRFLARFGMPEASLF